MLLRTTDLKSRFQDRIWLDQAGTVMLAIGLALLCRADLLAYALEGLVLVSLAAVIFGRFCQGSYLFLLFTGQSTVANRTLPWSQ